MVDELGVALGVILTFIVVVVHYRSGPTWRPRGDISQEVLEWRARTVPKTDFPEPMNRSIGGGFPAGMGVPGGAEGELGEPEAEEGESPAEIPDEEAGVFEIEFIKEGTSIDVKENETLLEAGEDEGWDLPYACREGQCLSCGARIPDGAADDFVVHWGQEMLIEDELDDGYILTCVAFPKTDFSIETRETP